MPQQHRCRKWHGITRSGCLPGSCMFAAESLDTCSRASRLAQGFAAGDRFLGKQIKSRHANILSLLPTKCMLSPSDLKEPQVGKGPCCAHPLHHNNTNCFPSTPAGALLVLCETQVIPTPAHPSFGVRRSQRRFSSGLESLLRGNRFLFKRLLMYAKRLPTAQKEGIRSATNIFLQAGPCCRAGEVPGPEGSWKGL